MWNVQHHHCHSPHHHHSIFECRLDSKPSLPRPVPRTRTSPLIWCRWLSFNPLRGSRGVKWPLLTRSKTFLSELFLHWMMQFIWALTVHVSVMWLSCVCHMCHGHASNDKSQCYCMLYCSLVESFVCKPVEISREHVEWNCYNAASAVMWVSLFKYISSLPAIGMWDICLPFAVCIN